MEEYYFLFFLAFVWMIFAAICDFKTREIPNWGNFSLIAVALAYRAFYSISKNDARFFVHGLIGTLSFIGLGFLFYYGRAFAGGDAKLLMALGAVLPFESYIDYFFIGLGFVFILFMVGAFYSLIYSTFLIRGKKGFAKTFGKKIGNRKLLVYGFLIAGIFAGIWFFSSADVFFGLYLLILGLMPLFYFYAKTVDEMCMIKLIKPHDLREGDWLVRDIKTGKGVIKNRVDGLNMKEIQLLKKIGKKVLIRDGLPFAISFLMAFMVFVFLFLRYGFSLLPVF